MYVVDTIALSRWYGWKSFRKKKYFLELVVSRDKKLLSFFLKIKRMKLQCPAILRNIPDQLIRCSLR